MVTDHRHPQPAQALAAHHNAGGGLRSASGRRIDEQPPADNPDVPAGTPEGPTFAQQPPCIDTATTAPRTEWRTAPFAWREQRGWVSLGAAPRCRDSSNSAASGRAKRRARSAPLPRRQESPPALLVVVHSGRLTLDLRDARSHGDQRACGSASPASALRLPRRRPDTWIRGRRPERETGGALASAARVHRSAGR
jgi:hypothetical protein